MQTHHVGTIHLDSGNSSSGVTQLAKGKKEIVGLQNDLTHSWPSQLVESGLFGGTKMTKHKDHAEGTSENQVNEEQSTFGF